jgi:hypothetical protein
VDHDILLCTAFAAAIYVEQALNANRGEWLGDSS